MKTHLIVSSSPHIHQVDLEDAEVCKKPVQTEVRGVWMPPTPSSSSQWRLAKAMHSDVHLGQEWRQNLVNKSEGQNIWHQQAVLFMVSVICMFGLDKALGINSQPITASTPSNNPDMFHTPKATRSSNDISPVQKQGCYPIRCTQQGHVQ